MTVLEAIQMREGLESRLDTLSLHMFQTYMTYLEQRTDKFISLIEEQQEVLNKISKLAED